MCEIQTNVKLSYFNNLFYMCIYLCAFVYSIVINTPELYKDRYFMWKLMSDVLMDQSCLFRFCFYLYRVVRVSVRHVIAL